MIRFEVRLPHVRLAGVLAVVGFSVLVARFWHPHYGFSGFIQLDEVERAAGVRELREQRLFWYEGASGYDGAAYAQIAFHPLLDDPRLVHGVAHLSYRARRILHPALAWLVAGGRPDRIGPAFAALNLAVWCVLAWLLWRVLGVADGRGLVAWAGVMFSAGALHCVRLALPDLLAATLVLGAMHLADQRRGVLAGMALGLAGLARETALSALAGVIRSQGNSGCRLRGPMLRALAALLPLGGWLLYVHGRAGPGHAGWGNFTWPLAGWLGKLEADLASLAGPAEFRVLAATTLLATAGITAQAIFVARRVIPGDPWWRLAATHVVLMAVLGPAVWEGHPGAATRVLLPLGIAFAVLAVRARVSWIWLVTGGLTVFSGAAALREVPLAPREIAAGGWSGGSHSTRLADGWHARERDARGRWAWSAGRRAALEIEPAGLPSGAALAVRLQVRAITFRPLEVWHGERRVWAGPIGPAKAWVELAPVVLSGPGEVRLELRSPEDPVPEHRGPGARSLGFALSGVMVVPAVGGGINP